MEGYRLVVEPMFVLDHNLLFTLLYIKNLGIQLYNIIGGMIL